MLVLSPYDHPFTLLTVAITGPTVLHASTKVLGVVRSEGPVKSSSCTKNRAHPTQSECREAAFSLEASNQHKFCLSRG